MASITWAMRSQEALENDEHRTTNAHRSCSAKSAHDQKTKQKQTNQEHQHAMPTRHLTPRSPNRKLIGLSKSLDTGLFEILGQLHPCHPPPILMMSCQRQTNLWNGANLSASRQFCLSGHRNINERQDPCLAKIGGAAESKTLEDL